MFLTLSLSAGNHCQVALNLVQHLTKSRAYETLKRVQGDTLGLFTRPSLIITTLFYKIPPHLPFPKGGKIPLFGKEGKGEILRNISILRPLICFLSLLENTLWDLHLPDLLHLFHRDIKNGISRREWFLPHEFWNVIKFF